MQHIGKSFIFNFACPLTRSAIRSMCMIVISLVILGTFLGIFKGSHQAAPEPMHLLTMAQAGCT